MEMNLRNSRRNILGTPAGSSRARSKTRRPRMYLPMERL
uniref:Uncharacterized protein n=1 Tax=Arcella intermedia TaxID=1963864 RepID=A0A6B2LW04_9EUKA